MYYLADLPYKYEIRDLIWPFYPDTPVVRRTSRKLRGRLSVPLT
jgi:hypothetical protein